MKTLALLLSALLLINPAYSADTADTADTNEKKATKGDNGKRDKTSLPGIPLPCDISAYTSLKVTSKDGSKFNMGYIAPLGKGPFPTILFLHGGLDTVRGGRGSLMKGAVQTRFLKKGYLIAHATRRVMRGDNYADVTGAADDTVAAIKTLQAVPLVDKNSFILYGGSAGANLAIHAASLTDVTAIVAGEPATLLMTGMYSKAGGSTGAVYKDFKKAYDSEAQKITQTIIKNLNCPVLMLHGGISQLNTLNKDYIIPEFKAANKTYINIDYPNNPHGFYWGNGTDLKTLEKVIEDSDQFIRKQIKTQPREI
ncbi:MAG: hypothetical protein QM496_02910 [Verrucomicrobiota bacterium]